MKESERVRHAPWDARLASARQQTVSFYWIFTIRMRIHTLWRLLRRSSWSAAADSPKRSPMLRSAARLPSRAAAYRGHTLLAQKPTLVRVRCCASQSAPQPSVTVPPMPEGAEETPEEPPETPALVPREIMAELDRYIVGQSDAKKAVSVAMRNRWRRQQVAPPLRDDIMPKNILMVGPTGVGKTEVRARAHAWARLRRRAMSR